VGRLVSIKNGVVGIVIGDLRQVATLANPGAPVPDGDGGFTRPYVLLDPSVWRCAVEKATVRSAERHFAATVLAHATHIFSGRFHPGITAQGPTQIVWTDRAGVTHTANVLDVDDTEGAGIETVALVSEVVSVPAPPPPSWMQTGWSQ
jgi:hypothetical protein